jgi:hypothetical protein
MMNYKMSIITSGITISVPKTDHVLNFIKGKAEEVIKDFLIISSSIQGCRHDWRFMLVESSGRPVFISIRNPGLSTPISFPLDNGTNGLIYNQLWKELQPFHYSSS